MKYFPDEPAESALAKWAVLAVPLLYLILSQVYSACLAPWGRQVDPESPYAMVGLAAAAGYQFLKNDHPGTTTILLVDVIIRVWAFFARSSDVVAFGLKHYVAIVYAARAAEAAILSAVLAVSGILVRSVTRSAVAAMLFQVAPFVIADAFHFEVMLIPESLMVSCTILAMALAVKAALDERPPTVGVGVASGLTFALGLSSKYLYLPLFTLGAALVRSRKAKLAFGLTAIFGFFIFNRIFNPLVFTAGFHWLAKLATHKGTYGEGEEGFIDFGVFWLNMEQIITAAPVGCALFVLGATAALAQMIKSRRFLDPVSVTLLAAFLAFFAQLVATSKHFALHYMMASWALTGGVLVLTIVEAKRLFPRASPGLLTGAGALVCAALVAGTMLEARDVAIEELALDRDGAKLSRAIIKAAPSCANVSSMFVHAPENILNFGGDIILGTPEIENQFSDAYTRAYNVPLLDHSMYRDGLIKNFHRYSYAKLAAEYPCIVVRSFWPLDAQTSKGLLELNPEHCQIAGIPVHTVGIACARIREAFEKE